MLVMSFVGPVGHVDPVRPVGHVSLLRLDSRRERSTPLHQLSITGSLPPISFPECMNDSTVAAAAGISATATAAALGTVVYTLLLRWKGSLKVELKAAKR